MPTLLAIPAALVMVSLLASPSSAHAVLKASDPAPNAILRAAPRAVTLTFDEPVTVLSTSLQVYGPNGQRVDSGGVRRPGGANRSMSVSLEPPTPHGTYLVSWRVLSADSHPTSGAFEFSVVDHSATPKGAVLHTDPWVALALGLSRFLGYVGCALFAGGLVFVGLCWRAGATSVLARRVLATGAVVSVLGAVAALLLKGTYDAALGFGAIGRHDLLTETLHTAYGKAVLVRAVIAGVAIAVLSSAARRRARWIGLSVLAAGLIATFPFTGHADTGRDRAPAFFSDLIHVTAMSSWLGGLTILVLIVLSRPAVAAGHDIATRFSKVALCCIAALLCTGTFQAWRQVEVWGALTGTTYGRELLVKVGLVVAVLAAAWYSRAWVTRQSIASAPVLTGLRRIVTIEAILAIAVIGLTSALVATEPARTAYHPVVAATLHLGPETIQVSAVPNGGRTMDVHLYEFDKDFQPIDAAEVTATVSRPDISIGSLPLTLRKTDIGHYVAHVSVPVSGTWSLTVTVRTATLDEYSKTLDLPIR